jgi:hypothetical protein
MNEEDIKDEVDQILSLNLNSSHSEIYKDLIELNNLIQEAKNERASITPVDLPEGFKELESDTRTEASKEYNNGLSIEVEYDEVSRYMRGKKDSSRVEIRIPEIDYGKTESWEDKF